MLSTLVILLLRLYAMYYHRRAVLKTLGFIAIGAMTATISVMAKSLSVMNGASY